MFLRNRTTTKKSVDMSGYIIIGLLFGALMGFLVGNLLLGAGIGMGFGTLLCFCAEI